MMLASERSHEHDLGAMSIHINTIRVLMSVVLPHLAQLSATPQAWLDDLRKTAQQTVDYVTFAAAQHINTDMMKAAVAGSVEEIFAGAQAMLRVQEAS